MLRALRLLWAEVLAVIRYYAEVITRTFSDAHALVEHWMRTALSSAAAIAFGFWIYSRSASAEARKDQWNEVLSFTLAPLGVLAAAWFIWNFIATPSRMRRQAAVTTSTRQNELNQTISGLRSELALIEEVRRSPFVVSAQARRQRVIGDSDKIYADISVENRSDRTVSDVEVRLLDVVHEIDLDKDTFSRASTIFEAWIPAAVTWVDTGQQRMNIPPHDSRDVRIGRGTASFSMGEFATSGGERPMHQGEYRIDIRVSAPEHGPLDESLYLEFHPIQEAVRLSDGSIVLGGGRAPGIEFISLAVWRAAAAIAQAAEKR